RRAHILGTARSGLERAGGPRGLDSEVVAGVGGVEALVGQGEVRADRVGRVRPAPPGCADTSQSAAGGYARGGAVLRRTTSSGATRSGSGRSGGGVFGSISRR